MISSAQRKSISISISIAVNLGRQYTSGGRRKREIYQRLRRGRVIATRLLRAGFCFLRWTRARSCCRQAEDSVGHLDDGEGREGVEQRGGRVCHQGWESQVVGREQQHWVDMGEDGRQARGQQLNWQRRLGRRGLSGARHGDGVDRSHPGGFRRVVERGG
jgi:hypothetical protein